MEEIRLVSKSFTELSVAELYDLLALRTDIFVVEQECAYPELDYYDQPAQHLMMYSGTALVACARTLPPDTLYKEPSIGRVAVKFNYRGKGLARKIFEASMGHLMAAYPNRDLKLQAQTYLEKFYAEFGFRRVSEAYPDYGIMHIDMIREAESGDHSS